MKNTLRNSKEFDETKNCVTQCYETSKVETTLSKVILNFFLFNVVKQHVTA